ncbi:MAG: WGR domain-containing protein [Nitrosarchaeum sp.]|nr:WGR domain-containing protein [Nitrosarchaeum sp.]
MKIGNEKKVKTSDVGDFSETKKFKVLFCGNVEGNNNKFYCLELQHNPKSGAYRLFSHYGRLGLSEVFGVKDDTKETPNKPITDFAFLEKEFDSIIKSKLRGKSIKDDRGLEESRRENYEEVSTFSPKVGSPNIRGKSVQVTSTTKQAVDVSTISNQKIVKLINQIVEENIHNITSLTSLTLTSNGFETPLGPVTKEQVQKAREVLTTLKSKLVKDKIDPDVSEVRLANNRYYSLIPHAFGHKIEQSDWILESNKLLQEFDLLDQLESAVQMGSAMKQNASQRLNALGAEIDELVDSNEFERLRKYVETSKASNHQHSDVWKWKVKNIFTLKIPHVHSKFESVKPKYGNVKELFHGSRNCNILSIVKNGLIIPPFNPGQMAGRMFGDGIYGASNSTKSLNYSTGWWTNNGNKHPNAFLFIVNFAMGKAYETKSTISKPPSGHDSVWARSGGGLYNDEFIVYSTNQATITHLIEMEK